MCFCDSHRSRTLTPWKSTSCSVGFGMPSNDGPGTWQMDGVATRTCEEASRYDRPTMSTTDQAGSKIPVLFVNTPTQPPIGADTWIHAEIIRCAGPVSLRRPRRARDRRAGGANTVLRGDLGCAETRTSCRSISAANASMSARRCSKSSTDWVSSERSSASASSPCTCVRRRIPIIHTVSRPRDAFACLLLARLTRRKCLIHMQLGFDDWMSWPLRWSLQHADGLVSISEFVTSTLTSNGVRPERIHLAYNAVVFGDWNPAADRGALRAELGLETTGPMVVNVSRLFPAKGTAELLRAIALVRKEIPDVRLVVVGRDVSGTGFMELLQAIVRNEDLAENVTFVGQRSDVVRFMGAGDVFAMPSFGEPFGIVFTEAMAMEIPVVALNNGGTPEVVDHGKAGLLSDPGDIATLASNLVTLLRDPDLRARMGAYGREQVAARFTTERLASEMARNLRGVGVVKSPKRASGAYPFWPTSERTNR